MLKVNLKQTFQTLDGKEFLGPDNKSIATMKDILKMVVTAELPDDAQGSGAEVLNRKMKNFDIYLKVNAETDEVDLEPEEIVILKDRAPKVLSVLMLGPLMRTLEGKQPYEILKK